MQKATAIATGKGEALAQRIAALECVGSRCWAGGDCGPTRSTPADVPHEHRVQVTAADLRRFRLSAPGGPSIPRSDRGTRF
jgi:hypothetical protein